MAENGTGTVIADPTAGAGGGAPAGGNGGEGGAPEPIVDEPIPGVDTGGEGGEPGAGGEGGEPGDKGGEGEGEPIPDENPYDGRKVDDATKKQLAALRKADPNLAKTAAEAIFSRKAILAEFPDAKGVGDVINSIREIKQTLEAVGGQEGLTALQENNRKYETEIEQFANGDMALLEDLHQSDPNGLALSIENGLQLLMERNGTNGDLFDKAMAVPFASRIRQAGLHTALAKIDEAIKSENVDDLIKTITGIKNWVGQVDRYAEEVGKGKDPTKLDPRERALNDREQKIKTQETERQKADYVAYENKVGAGVNTLANEALKPLIDGAVKDLKLQGPGAKRLTDAVQSEIWAKMKADKTFQRNAQAIVKKGDAEKSSQFIAAKFKSLLRDTYRSVFNELYPNAGSARTSSTTGANSGGGKAAPAAGGAKAAPANKVAYKGGRPGFDMVEWSKTPDEDWLRGVAVLTDGTKITFDPNSPPNRFN
jgi:hypothetical protein